MTMLNDKPPKARTIQKRATRAAIIDAAQKLFLADGYDATTTRDIAQSCGVATGTVFAHFPEKERILREILTSNIAELLDEVRPGIPTHAGGCDALLAYAAKLIPNYLAMPELSRIMLASVMFDREAYRQQLEFFVAEIAARLRFDAPLLPPESRLLASEMLFANYLFVVVEALGDEASSAASAVTRLEARCRLLIAPYGMAK